MSSSLFKFNYSILIGIIISVNLTIVPFIIGIYFDSFKIGFKYLFLSGGGLLIICCRIALLRNNRYIEHSPPKLIRLKMEQEFLEKQNSKVSEIKPIITKIEQIQNKIISSQNENRTISKFQNICLIFAGICGIIYFFIDPTNS